MKLKFIGLFFVLLFLNACSDNAIVNIYDKNILKEKIPCMNLVIFPPNSKTQNVLEKLYGFEVNCSYDLRVSQKSGITCNSTHNTDKKILNSFPSSYLNLSLYKKGSLAYSYYIDLEESVSEEDIKKGFSKIREDLNLISR